jgi:hypothetical protein
VTVPIAILSPICVEYQSPRYGNENAHIFLFFFLFLFFLFFFKKKDQKERNILKEKRSSEDAPLIAANFKLA